MIEDDEREQKETEIADKIKQAYHSAKVAYEGILVDIHEDFLTIVVDLEDDSISIGDLAKLSEMNVFRHTSIITAYNDKLVIETKIPISELAA